jgi:hypothetical protein
MNLDGVSHPDSLQRHASGGRRRVESVREEVVEDLLEMTWASEGS